MKRYQINILFHLLALIVTIGVGAFMTVKGLILPVILIGLVIIYQIWVLFKYISKSNAEIEQFIESVHYRDFTRNFDVKNAAEPIKDLRRGFNEINSTFKLITKERETQFIYLQKILELVDTGIICYDTQSGDIMWVNEAFKKLLGIPYLKTIYSLEKRDKPLFDTIISLKPQDNKITTVTTENKIAKLLITATSFKSEEKTNRLIAFQNINEVVDETESEAWRKLLSVMTHEIMNSIAPITSLADTISRQISTHTDSLSDNSKNTDNAPINADIQLGIETIRKRSEGLLKFAETYRNLNKISTLNCQKVYVRDLFENIYQLMHPTLEEKNIELDIILKDTNIQVEADSSLIEQALINLVVNAIEAVKTIENPTIQLSAALNAQQKVVIKITDNGCGIPDELIDQIFIPFFSTRKSGSGIGLSLCKQIMLLHKGNIKVQSTEGVGTIFSLSF